MFASLIIASFNSKILLKEYQYNKFHLIGVYLLIY